MSTFISRPSESWGLEKALASWKHPQITDKTVSYSLTGNKWNLVTTGLFRLSIFFPSMVAPTMRLSTTSVFNWLSLLVKRLLVR